jgi:hypothetical protein
MKLMLNKKQAKKLAQCLAMIRKIRTAKSSFQDDKELHGLFTEVDTALKDTLSNLDTVEYKMVMILYARFIAGDTVKRLPLRGRKASKTTTLV